MKMSNESQPIEEPSTAQVKTLILADQFERRLAKATVVIGEITIHELTVWRSHGGRLKVLWPAYRGDRVWKPIVELPEALRLEVERAVLNNYKERRIDERKDIRN